VIEYADAGSPVAFETAIPKAAVSLNSIDRTRELRERPSRPPDYEKENGALAALAIALADSPGSILQVLAERVLAILGADSAGLSLLTKDGTMFHWAAVAGVLRQHAGGSTPRNFSPCGDVLDRNAPILFTHWEHRYTYLATVLPLAEESLLVPFSVNGRSIGAVWAISHSSPHMFDAEDLRLLESMGRFTAAACQTLQSIENLELEVAARQNAQTSLRLLADNLEEQVRVRTEELYLSERRWKRFFDNSAVGIATVDIDGRFEITNSAYQKMVGFTQGELTGKPYLDLILPDFRPLNIALVTELLDGWRDQFNIEMQCQRKGGRLIWVRNNVSLLRGADGASRTIMSIVEDISECKAVEESLQLTQAQLSHAAEVATAAELSASIAHELNQPLAGIVNNANTCLRMLDAAPPNVRGARETARRTIRDGSRASEVISRLRALFSRNAVFTESVDLNAAVQEVIALSISKIKRDRVVLRVDLTAGLPLVTGNRVQLQQVILNLLQNAIDAMIDVQDRPKQLLIKTERDGDGSVRLSVEDTGVGFAPEAVNKLFDTFYTTKKDGMGVGLSVSRSIIENHSGRLWATSNNGPGATFWLSIPQQTGIRAGARSRDSARKFVDDGAVRT
jgi:PAS domain S-box-containing protein